MNRLENINYMSKQDYLDYCIKLLEGTSDKLVLFDILVDAIQEFKMLDYDIEDLEYFDSFEMADWVEDNYSNILNLLYYIKENECYR